MKNSVVLFIIAFIVCSCGVAKKIDRSARKDVMGAKPLQQAHVGISVFDVSKNKYLYNYQGDHYFVPASNTKIATCYAAMKYLGKTLPGLKYTTDSAAIYIYPTGDPTFLHPEFERQRVYDFLKNADKKIVLNIGNWQEDAWGSGWAWNDYNDSYMAERSAMPMYGNVVRISDYLRTLNVAPNFFRGNFIYDSSKAKLDDYVNGVQRDIAANHFVVTGQTKKAATVEVPYYTNNSEIAYLLLRDTLPKFIVRSNDKIDATKKLATIHSQPTDSLLKPMMHRSDNFFAEQSLLMVSNELLGVMNDAKIIDTLLKSDYKLLPQKPRWVDGSGLSRYNLFTPQDLVFILNKIQSEFGMERVKTIFATGNEGTLTNYYKDDAGYVFAKTGTVSGVVALSGYVYTKKGKLLLFSVLVNNHNGSATEVRRAIEKFVKGLRKIG